MEVKSTSNSKVDIRKIWWNNLFVLEHIKGKYVQRIGDMEKKIMFCINIYHIEFRREYKIMQLNILLLTKFVK